MTRDRITGMWHFSNTLAHCFVIAEPSFISAIAYNKNGQLKTARNPKVLCIDFLHLQSYATNGLSVFFARRFAFIRSKEEEGER